MNQIVNYGLAGCGYVCERHIKAIQSLPGAKLAAICDVDAVRARAVAEKFGIGSVESDFLQMVRRHDIDAVVLTVPTHLHEPFTVMAAENGKHVFVEKPIAGSLHAATNMIRACREAGVKLCVGQSHRYFPLSGKVKAFLQRGTIGAVRKVRAFNCHFANFHDEKRPWKMDSGNENGELLDTGIHYADNLRFILGKDARRVSGRVRKVRSAEIPIKDDGIALVEFEDNTSATIEISMSQQIGDPLSMPGEGIEIHGENGSLCLSVLSGRMRGFCMDGDGKKSEFEEAEVPQFEQVWHDLHRDFLASIRDAGRESPIPGEDGRKALEIMEALFRSSAERREIEIGALGA